jgi:hypothetical protein
LNFGRVNDSSGVDPRQIHPRENQHCQQSQDKQQSKYFHDAESYGDF